MLAFALTLASLCTALLSGVFGMAGGMLLMGVYTSVLPVPAAMVMHGGTQLIANLSRATLLGNSVYWRGVVLYAVGALLAFAALWHARYVPAPWLVFLGLGMTPFAAAALPRAALDFERPHAALLVGVQVVAVQLVAGAAGPLLDVAFLDTGLTRQQVVATKAVTQVFSHVLKLAYFIPALQANAITPGLALSVLCATLIGTRLGTLLLERMSEASFRRYSRAIVYAIGGIYLCKAGLQLLS